MNPRNLALIVILASPASAQGPETGLPVTCDGPGLAKKVLELLDPQPTYILPSSCNDLTSICQSEARVEALAQSLAEEQALLQLKYRTAALARRCL